MKIKKLSKAELKDNENKFPNVTFLEPREWLDNAIVGVDASTGGLIYNLTSIVDIFVHKDNLGWVDATDMVELNFEKTIPKMKKPHPIVMRLDDENKDIDDFDLDDNDNWE
jgi:hypothetical protein